MSTEMLTLLELETGWLTTAASQIFLMQLGFLCFEVGYVDQLWTKSIIIKNVEDTFIGALTFVMIGYTLTTGDTYFGVIGKLDNILLIGVDTALFTSIFLNTCYATTCATIISGAVLERMTNTAYIAYTFLVLVINYSLASCWVWNEDGWLYQLGIVDCAGAFIVHGVGGMAGFVAAYNLGPRKGSLACENEEFDEESEEDEEGKLSPPHAAKQPVLMVIGTFILWYGWFSFNITSPMIANLDIADHLAQSAMNVLIAPCCSALTCLMYCKIKSSSSHEMVNFEDLLSCILAGLVAVTGCCYTIQYWAACIVGIVVVPIYFLTAYYIREVLYVDDPLNVSAVHLLPGFYGIIAEGIFADGMIKGSRPGLLYGGYKHFGFQLLAVVIGFISQLTICVIIWHGILKRILFKNDNIAICSLDTYLSLGYFDPKSTLKEMLLCHNETEKKMLLEFKQLCNDNAKTYQLDFLVCVTRLKKKYNTKNLKKLYELYCENNSVKNIHITQNEQDVILKNINNCQEESLDINIKSYDIAYRFVFDGLQNFVKEFLQNYAENKYKSIESTVKLKDKYLPFLVDREWNVQWMTDPIRVNVSPMQEHLIQERRVRTSQHIARLSHDSYLDYHNMGNDHGKTKKVRINMEPIKESDKKQTLNSPKTDDTDVVNTSHTELEIPEIETQISTRL